MNEMHLLEKNPLFKGIQKEEIAGLLTCLHSHEKQYAKNELILRQGASIREIGLVLEGQAHIIRDDYWGNHTIISEVNCGQFFGEAYACVPSSELEVSVIASTDARILFLSIGHILTTCQNACPFHQRIIQNLLSIVAAKNLLLNQKMEHITKRSTREKVLSYLSSQSLRTGSASVTIPFNRQQLADYLSVDRSALSGELSRMQKEGVLTYRKNTFTLLL